MSEAYDYSAGYVGPENIMSDFPVLASGKAGQPLYFTRGGAYATGKILFSANLVATNTITINGTVFTAVASGATGAQFNIGASLSVTLDNIVTVLNASAVAGVALATYSKTDTNAALTAIYDTRGEAGNAFTLATSVGTAVVTAMAGGQEVPAIPLWSRNTQIDLTQALDQAFTLADGSEFQQHAIVLKTKSGVGNAVILGNFATSNTTLTLSAANQHVILEFLGGRWRAIVNTGALV